MKALNDTTILNSLLDDVHSKTDSIRFQSFVVLNHLSAHHPEILYQKWDEIASLLQSNNHYLRYISVHILANLSKIDTSDKFETCFDEYFQNINSKRTMIAGQSLVNAGKIAKYKPNLRQNITDLLLNIENTHQGKHIDLMKAYVIEAFNTYFEQIENNGRIIMFVKQCVGSNSPKTMKMAKEFLKHWNIPS